MHNYDSSVMKQNLIISNCCFGYAVHVKESAYVKIPT